jgi:hypothetical protein
MWGSASWCDPNLPPGSPEPWPSLLRPELPHVRKEPCELPHCPPESHCATAALPLLKVKVTRHRSKCPGGSCCVWFCGTLAVCPSEIMSLMGSGLSLQSPDLVPEVDIRRPLLLPSLDPCVPVSFLQGLLGASARCLCCI